MAFISVPFESAVVNSWLFDGVGNPITSQASGAQRALDVGINVAGVQVDPRDIRALTAADVVTAQQGTSPWVVSGTVTANQGGTWNINNISGTISLPTGAATEATLDSFYQLHKSATPGLSQVASSLTSVTLIASNANRKQLFLFNDSTKICYVTFGATSSAAAFTVRMEPRASFILNNDPIYTGVVSGIWQAVNGDMKVTELT